MCDYEADGAWNKNGAAVCADWLPIDAELVDRIRIWQQWWETADPSVLRNEPFDTMAFAAEGLAIAKAVKSALPSWTVIYFDQAKCGMNGPRSEFEYEICLSESP